MKQPANSSHRASTRREPQTVRRQRSSATSAATASLAAGARVVGARVVAARVVGARVVAALVAGALALSVTDADALTDDHERCIAKMTSAAAKVGTAQFREALDCVVRSSKTGLGSDTILHCAQADASGKVESAVADAIRDDIKYCLRQAPPFGYASSTVANDAAIDETLALARDIHGPALDAATMGRDKAKCIHKAARAYDKLRAVKAKTYRRCLEDAMRAGTLAGASNLQDCMDAVAADARGQVAKTREKLARVLGKPQCLGERSVVDAAAVFGGTCLGRSESVEQLSECIDERIDCRTCRTNNLVNNLTRDCDLFDDGAANRSCAQTYPTCDDLVLNQDETGIDCGGASCAPCAAGDACAVAGDCASAVCSAEVCQAPTCIDGVVNQDEADVDCGGACPGCAVGALCLAGADCASGVCIEALCVAATCSDLVANGDESDVDCGGSCLPCAPGSGCASATDCSTGVCSDQTCQTASCSDAVANGGESDVDCGGSCGGCADGAVCVEDTDCLGRLCSLGVCVAPPIGVAVTSPAHGAFVSDDLVTIAGEATTDATDATLTVNGTPVAVGRAPTYAWNTEVPLDSVLNPVEVVFARGGVEDRERIVVVGGDSVADGDVSPSGVGLRFNQSGFDRLETMVTRLVELDLSTLIPLGLHVGSASGYEVYINAPAPSYSDPLSLNFTSLPGVIDVSIELHGLRADLFMDHPPTIFDCWAFIRTNGPMQLNASFSLEPHPADPNRVDVVQVGSVSFGSTDFVLDITAGICTLAEAFGALPEIDGTISNALSGFLNALDANGNTPLAGAIEGALGGIAISGPVGDGLGLQFDAPMVAVAEEDEGLTIEADARFVSPPGSGPGPCDLPADVPDFAASYHVEEGFPSFAALSPNGSPYELGIAISSSGFSQLLKATTECGLLREELTEIDLGGGPLAVTAGFLSAFVPEFAALGAETPIVIRIRPTMAPIVSGAAGPGGTLAELLLGQLRIEFVGDAGLGAGPEVFLALAVDAAVGLDLALVDGNLAPTIAALDAGTVDVFVTDNPIGAHTGSIEAFFPAIFAPLVPSLGNALSAFPLPEFLGFQLDTVEVGRAGNYIALFTNMVEAPPGGTIITHDAFTVDNGAPPANYGDRVAESGGNYTVLTKDGVTGTPNVEMVLATTGDARKETWRNWQGRGAVLQLQDKEAVDSNEFRFIPDPGWAVRVVSFDLDKWPGGGTPFHVEWSVFGASSGLLASGTWDLNFDSGRSTVSPLGAMGYLGEEITLRFRHVYGDGSFLAIDNLHFEQTADAAEIPPPGGTILTNSAFTHDNGGVPANYGDHVSASGGNYIAYTRDGVTGTPDIALGLSATGNAKKQTWRNWDGRGAALQLEDRDGIDNNDFVFTPGPDHAVRIVSFELDKWVGGGTPFRVDWFVLTATGTLASGTWVFDTGGGREAIFPMNATGPIGEPVTLRIRHTHGDGAYLAIDNLHFEQVDFDPS